MFSLKFTKLRTTCCFICTISVQWSSRADFSNIVGEREVNEWNSFQGTMGATCRITELTQGRRYFVRVSCGNVKGWGQYRLSIPSSVVPSSKYIFFFY